MKDVHCEECGRPLTTGDTVEVVRLIPAKKGEVVGKEKDLRNLSGLAGVVFRVDDDAWPVGVRFPGVFGLYWFKVRELRRRIEQCQ